MNDETRLTIGQLAERTGFKASAIRYYESIGVLPPASREGGQRRYELAMVDRLGMVGAAQQVGFSLEEISSLFRSSDEGQVSEELQSIATERLTDVNDLIERANRMKTWLETATGCGCATLEDCSLFVTGNRDAAPAVLSVIGRNHRSATDCAATGK